MIRRQEGLSALVIHVHCGYICRHKGQGILETDVGERIPGPLHCCCITGVPPVQLRRCAW